MMILAFSTACLCTREHSAGMRCSQSGRHALHLYNLDSRGVAACYASGVTAASTLPAVNEHLRKGQHSPSICLLQIEL